MTSLRNHLDLARHKYQAYRYPGDLASDVLPPVRRLAPWAWGISAVAAAVLVVVINLHKVAPVPEELASVEQPAAVQEVSLGDLPAVTAPELPSDIDLSLPAMEMSFSPPSFTLLDESTVKQTSTTQEAT